MFRIIAVLIVFQGARLNFSLVWDTADVTMGFMALINLPSIVLLAKPALLALQDYTRQRREGRTGVSCGGHRPRRQNGLLELKKRQEVSRHLLPFSILRTKLT